MGRFKKEVKAFGKDFARQGSILLFGYRKKRPGYNPRREYPGVYRNLSKAKYRNYRSYLKTHDRARQIGFKK